MPEMLDIYTEAGERTGRTIVKGTPRAPGDFLLHAIVLICDMRGIYLLQQRSLGARYFPGKWDVTGGGVISGEDSREAAIREAFEELGLTLDPQGMVYAGRTRQENDFYMDMWGAKLDFDADSCVLNPYEVNAVRMAPYGEFAQTVSYNKSEAFMDLMRRMDSLLRAL